MNFFISTVVIIWVLASLSTQASSQPIADLAKREGIPTFLYFSDAVRPSGEACQGAYEAQGPQVRIGGRLGGAEKCGKKARVDWKEGVNRRFSVEVLVNGYGADLPVLAPPQDRETFRATQKTAIGKGVFWTWL